MPIIRAQVVLAMESALPEDSVVNTFHFNVAPGDLAASDDDIYAGLQNFYIGGGQPLGGILANTLNDGVGAHEIRQYNLSDPEPRTPISIRTFTLAGGGGNPLPSEVAICSSFQAVGVSGESQARRRGRVFIGPLGASALGTDGRPSATALTRVAASADGLATEMAAGVAPWVVYSVVDDVGYLIDNGWVDNAFDTQRRRGVAPTARTTWVGP